jgi:hypothetical protein
MNLIHIVSGRPYISIASEEALLNCPSYIIYTIFWKKSSKI